MSDLSRSENIDLNLPFYLNHIEEPFQDCLCLRLKGNLNYTNVISGKKLFF